MKDVKRHSSQALLFLLAAFIPMAAFSQERRKPRIDLGYFRVQQEAPYLIAKVRTKDGKKFEPVTGVKVTLFVGDQELGTVTTDKNGEGKLVIPDKINSSLDSLVQYSFAARLPSNAKVEAAEGAIDIHQARMTLDTSGSDSLKQLHIRIEQREKVGWAPVSGVEMKIFVKRLFNNLPVGEATYTSDENGKVEMDFKASVPGDKTGKIVVGCMIEDNENFGNLTTVKEVVWGTPFVAGHDEFNDRTLWATRDKTPIWLLVFPNLIIIVVWGLIVFLIIQLLKIRKIGMGTKD